MARQEGPVFLDKVTIDGIIYYKWKGIYLIRKAPGKSRGKQTKATKLSALTFGTSSTAAKLLYDSFKNVIPPYLHHITTYNRIKKMMTDVIGKGGSREKSDQWNYTYLENFAFNEHAILPLQSDHFRVIHSLDKNELQIYFPAVNMQKVTAPKNTVSMSFRAAMGVFDFAENKLLDYEEKDLNYSGDENNVREKDLVFSLEAARPQTTTIIGLQVLFYDLNNELIFSKLKPEYDGSILLWASFH